MSCSRGYSKKFCFENWCFSDRGILIDCHNEIRCFGKDVSKGEILLGTKNELRKHVISKMRINTQGTYFIAITSKNRVFMRCREVDNPKIKSLEGGAIFYSPDNTNDEDDSNVQNCLEVLYFQKNALYVTDIAAHPYHNFFPNLGSNYQGIGGYGVEKRENDLKFKKVLLECKGGEKIFIGGCHFVFALSEGKVYSWGYNPSGVQGHGDSKNRCKPTLIQFFVKNNIHVTDIATGFEHAIFLDDNQKVYSCGWNLYGTLGLGDTGNRSVPELVKFVSSIGVLSVKCGWQHSLFLTKKGVFATGLSDNNRLGFLTMKGIPRKVTTPIPVKFRERFGRKAVQIACSYSGSFFLDEKGNVYAVGRDAFDENSSKLRLVYSGGIKAYLSPSKVHLDKLSKRLNRQRIRRRRVDVIVRH
jgi:hypothetical protein